MDLVLVGIGGALGSLARFSLGKMMIKRTKASFLFGTFAINISGAMLLGAVSGLSISTNAYLLLGDGFLGAYTTFSTFMYEGFQLSQSKKKNAVVYVIGTLTLGMLGYLFGFMLSKIAVH